jgi:hypothetical protein
MYHAAAGEDADEEIDRLEQAGDPVLRPLLRGGRALENGAERAVDLFALHRGEDSRCP